MTAQPRRDSKRYRALKVAFRAECQAVDEPCWLCGQPVDWSVEVAGPDDPEGFSLDHFHPWSTHPEYRLDPGNFRCAHWLCNSDRGDRAPAPSLGVPSRVW